MQAPIDNRIGSAAIRFSLIALLGVLAFAGCKNTVEEDCNLLINTYCSKLGECKGADVATCLAGQSAFIDCKRLQSTYDSCTHDWDYCEEDLRALSCTEINAPGWVAPDSCRRISTAPCTRGEPLPP